MTGAPPDAGPAAPPGPAQARAGLRWWALAVVAVAAGVTLGAQLAHVIRPGGPVTGSSAALAATGGVFTPGNGQPAPGWSLPGLSGADRVVTLRQFRGRPVVVNFWASWCTPCRTEMPALERTSRLLAGRVAIVGLDTQDDPAAGLSFARKMGVTYPLAVANAQVWSPYGVQALPTTFFISARGTVVGEDFGAMTQDSLLRLIRRLYGIAPRG